MISRDALAAAGGESIFYLNSAVEDGVTTLSQKVVMHVAVHLKIGNQLVWLRILHTVVREY